MEQKNPVVQVNNELQIKRTNIWFMFASLLLLAIGAALAALIVAFNVNVNSTFILIPVFMIGSGVAIIFSMLSTENQNLKRNKSEEVSSDIKDIEERIEKIDLETKSAIDEIRESVARDYDKIYAKPAQIDKDEQKADSTARRRRINALKFMNRIDISGNYLQERCNEFRGAQKITLIASLSLSISGIIPLLIAMFSNHQTSDIHGITELIIKKWPYMGLTILIEIVAGLIMKIYFKQLEESRFHMNEITNISLISASIYASYVSEDKESLKHALKRAADTERNRILKKGEFTEEIEKIKLSNEFEKNIIDQIAKKIPQIKAE